MDNFVNKSADKYLRSDIKTKLFERKRKYSKFPGSNWVKLGQGRNTNQNEQSKVVRKFIFDK
jgi:hypothetical protein